MIENEDIDLLVEILDNYTAEGAEDKVVKLNKKIHLIQDQIHVQSEAQAKIQEIHEKMKNL